MTGTGHRGLAKPWRCLVALLFLPILDSLFTPLLALLAPSLENPPQGQAAAPKANVNKVKGAVAMIQQEGVVNQVGLRCLVAGRVQGVFFRASAREQALRLGLTGYARNLPDGRVEVLACGPVEAVARLRDWLRNGPPLAEVTAIVSEPVPFQPLSGFATH